MKNKDLNMKHLCYVYINEYKCLKDIELVIDCHYKYKYDKEKRTLNITNNKDFPNKFWGESIYSITGLVGNNGAGKSTAMRYLLDFLIDEYRCNTINGIVVYEEDHSFVYYGDDISIYHNGYPIKAKSSSKNSKWKIPCIYYSGHFALNTNDNLRIDKLEDCYNISDNFLLVKDYSYYYNIATPQSNLPLKTYLETHWSQNNYRICTMLANQQISHIIKDFTWPQYVVIRTNQSGASSLPKEISLNNKYKDLNIPTYRSVYNRNHTIDDFMSLLIYHNLINIIFDRPEFEAEDGFRIIEEWQNGIKNDMPIIDQFRDFIKGINDTKKKIILNSTYNVLQELMNLTEFSLDNSKNPYLFIDCKKNSDNLIALGEKILKNNVFLTSKFFDIYYSHSLDSETRLSSGEQELLNLFSRLYDVLYYRPTKFSNVKIPHLITLDEAEIGFHPDWQRKFLNLVIEFIDALKIMQPKIPDCQIIISTHSPILLSDIPKCCTNFLKKDSDNTTKNVHLDDIGETFAANVFNLYRMSFFMENGLVGEWACNKINKLNNRIEQGDTDGIMKEIKMIGDERIQEYLMDKYQKMHPEDKSLSNDIIKYYEERIEQIKKGKEN